MTNFSDNGLLSPTCPARSPRVVAGRSVEKTPMNFSLPSYIARMTLGAVVASTLMASIVEAGVIYVDNRLGNDLFDGTLPAPTGGNVGPVRTLQRALRLADGYDTLLLTNTGVPYTGSISLVGGRLSGSDVAPLTIDGQGATLSGWQEIPTGSWQQETADLWSLALTRKGYYVFTRGEELLPAFGLARGESPVTIPDGHWGTREGRIYLKTSEDRPPTDDQFGFAAHQTGITLHQVRNVRIANLTVEYFRFDGIHAQNDCANIVLENVTLRRNGRAGLAVSGAASLKIVSSTIQENGEASLLISRPALVESVDTTFDVEPMIAGATDE